MTPLNVQIKVLPHGKYFPLPFYATPGSAGMDLAAAIPENIPLGPRERLLIPCGFCMALPVGYEAQIRPRSGLAFKNGITVINSPGTIDSDYRGEIRIPLINLSKDVFVIEPGMRIAQMVIAPYVQALLVEMEDFHESEKFLQRSVEGFGSTGLFIKKTD